MDEVERIAKGLLRTKARLAAFNEVAEAGEDGLGFGRCSLRSRRELADFGLIERAPGRVISWQPVRERLTPLGLRVLSALQRIQPAPDRNS